MRAFNPSWPLRAAALFVVVFGALTIRSGASVLFGGEMARTAGNYVPFVVWFNFLAGFAYLAAGAGLWLGRRWAVWLAAALAVATLAAFAALGLYVAGGAPFEPRTVWAMTVRSATWVAITVFGCRAVSCRLRAAA
jgi:peptidoglycan/LPS O-acetylase OafA/YrhL